MINGQLHPADLKRRRARCAPILQKLTKLDTHIQRTCNICGCEQNVLLSVNDRYGLPASTVWCVRCGLIYMKERFTQDSYSEFYASGAYRCLSDAFRGVSAEIADIEHDQEQYAARLLNVLRTQLTPRPGARLLDIGGSAGLVARQIGEHFGFIPTILDPSVEEIKAARASGLEGIIGTLETFETPQKFDVILLCRSIEHLYDLQNSLNKIRSLSAEDGLFYCDIVDYLESCRGTGPPHAVSKIDHCYWLCQETAPSIFRHLGFEILSMDISSAPDVIGYVLRRCEPAPLQPVSAKWLESAIRKLRESDAEWRTSAATSLDLRDMVHHAGYRAKRKLLRTVRQQRPKPDSAPPEITIPDLEPQRELK